MNAYERLCAARKSGRPTARKYIEALCDSFFELHGDRLFADDPAILGGIAELDGMPVTVIGIEKGEDTKEKITRNFGSPNPEGYRKALRLMTQAEKFHRPVLCFVDTSGAYCGIGAEERGQGQAIAECLTQTAALQTPVISVLIGEGGSGGALALAAGDRVWMLENAVYSVISPEGCASILWKDASRAEQAAQQLKLTAEDALQLGVIEKIIPETDLGKPEFYEKLKQALLEELTTLSRLTPEALLEARYRRFRQIGADTQTGGVL